MKLMYKFLCLVTDKQSLESSSYFIIGTLSLISIILYPTSIYICIKKTGEIYDNSCTSKFDLTSYFYLILTCTINIWKII